MNKFVKLSYLNHTMTCDKLINVRVFIVFIKSPSPPPKKNEILNPATHLKLDK